MPTEIVVHAVHQGAMHVVADAGEHRVSMDYPLKPGNAGFTPLQLLLASLAGCSASTLAALLRKGGQAPEGLEVTATGVRREEHPTVFTQISLEFVVRGGSVDQAVAAKALSQAEQLVCPVWAMLKAGTPISASLRVVKG